MSGCWSWEASPSAIPFRRRARSRSMVDWFSIAHRLAGQSSQDRGDSCRVTQNLSRRSQLKTITPRRSGIMTARCQNLDAQVYFSALAVVHFPSSR